MKTVKTAPSAADIAGLDDTYYLNLPGDPLNAGMHLRDGLRRPARAGKAPPITYAHIARETGHRGLVVQYWFFWYFNQFNDLHEGDWEGMQIAFDADTAAGALKQGPSRDRALPARRRRGGRLGRRRGREGGDPPGRLSGRRLPRHLLRVGDLRRERTGRRRPGLRQHQRPAAAAGPAAGADPDLPAAVDTPRNGSPTTATGASARRATTTAPPGRRRRPSGRSRSPGWTACARPARSSRPAACSARPPPAPSAAPWRRCRTWSTSRPVPASGCSCCWRSPPC